MGIIVVIKQHYRLTAKPEEVIDASEQLHSHVVVDQSVLQHACLEAQVSNMLPHPSLTALFIMPEIKQAGDKRINSVAQFKDCPFCYMIIFSCHQSIVLL